MDYAQLPACCLQKLYQVLHSIKSTPDLRNFQLYDSFRAKETLLTLVFVLKPSNLKRLKHASRVLEPISSFIGVPSSFTRHPMHTQSPRQGTFTTRFRALSEKATLQRLCIELHLILRPFVARESKNDFIPLKIYVIFFSQPFNDPTKRSKVRHLPHEPI